MSKDKNFVVQGGVLALASILVRILGLIYRTILVNVLGSTVMGYYASAYDIYSLFLLLSSMSMPIAVSKLVSARLANGEYKNAKKIFHTALGFSCFLGVIFAALLFFGADTISTIIGYKESAYAMRVLAPTLFVMSILGVYRGYFQGMGSMVPTAISQILEQIANCVFSILGGIYLLNVGKELGKPEALGAMGVTVGTLVGAVCALAFFRFIYGLEKTATKKRFLNDKVSRKNRMNHVLGAVIATVVPVLLSTTIYQLCLTFNSTIFANVCSKVLHMEESAYTLIYSVYSNQYKLLTLAPVAIASAMSSAIIPSLVKSLNAGSKRELQMKVNAAIKITTIIAFPCGFGLALLATPILSLLFPDPETIHLSVSLMRFAVLSVVGFSLSTLTNAILQGIDKLKLPVIHVIIALIIHTILVFIMLIPLDYGIKGVVICDIVYAFVIVILNFASIKKYLNYKQEILKPFILPLFASCIMGIIAFGFHKFSYLFLENLIGDKIAELICTLLSVLIAVLVYFLLLFSLNIVDEKELKMLPMGSKIGAIARKFGVM